MTTDVTPLVAHADVGRAPELPFDPSEIRYELSRIGNNLNQIARKVNTNNETMVEDMRSARDIMREVQKVLTEQVKRGQR